MEPAALGQEKLARLPPASYHAAMPARRRPPAAVCRALRLLAGSPHEGVAEGVILANGVTVERMASLVRAGLATATPQRVVAGGRRMGVATLRITDAGWHTLGPVGI